MQPALFSFSEYWPFYVGFLGLVLFLLALDLGVFHRKAHAVQFKEALLWTLAWIGLAMLFNWGLYEYALYKFEDPMIARRLGLEFLTGYLVEKSLAIDNIFVFVLIFSYFAIPAEYQHRVLFFGILGALVFRVIFIAMGSVLMQYHLVVWIFGAFLVVTGLKVMFTHDRKIEPEKNPLIKLLRKIMPVTPHLHGDKFFIKQNAVWTATPLFVALVFLEFSDIIFAVDSVPAIFAVTHEPFLVLTSNVFAILGLRSMYFLVGDLMTKLRFLNYGLGAILIFVGMKMVWLNDAFGGKFPIGISLAIIATILFVTVMVSLLFPEKKPVHTQT